MKNQEGEIRIYVACLAAYNNGILHGCWINADQEAWEIWAGIAAMLKASPIEGAEEFAIHDYEGFEDVHIREYQGIDSVAKIAAFISEHGALGGKLVEYFGDLEDARAAMDERYHGRFASLADYVQDLTEECTAIPEHLRFYIDWQAMARDAELSGDVFTVEIAHDEIHVFSGA